MPTDKLAQRLALLEGVDLSEDDLDYIAAEIEDLERVTAELEEFAQATPWVSQQVQPMGNKV
jgi:aldehyde:ferredoxin oxidoreductase